MRMRSNEELVNHLVKNGTLKTKSIIEMQKEFGVLKTENEQLKQENIELEKMYKKLWDTYEDKGTMQFNEIEQLKQEIERMKECINNAINHIQCETKSYKVALILETAINDPKQGYAEPVPLSIEYDPDMEDYE